MNYSNNEMNFMRQDALRRTREMHRQNINKNNVQAQSRISKEPRPVSEPVLPDIEEKKHTFEPARKTETDQKTASQETKRKQTGGLNGLFSSLFSGGKPDNDKIIIIALIVILAKEGADIKLLIALGYILM